MTVETVNNLLGPLVVVAEVITAILLFSLISKKEKQAKRILTFFSPKALQLSFLVALTSMLGSLYYSEIAGYEPCKLCWYQRILMYPLVLLLGFAHLKKRKDVVDYALLMSLIGSVLAGYHYLLQIGVAPSLGCEAIGYSISCSKQFVLQYGYISIPLMAFSAFAFISTLLIVNKIISGIRK